MTVATTTTHYEEDSTNMASTGHKICEGIKLVTSTLAVSFFVIIACIGIISKWCILQLHPAANFLLLLCALILLAYVEALHYSCVSIEKWDMSMYVTRFPRAYKCYKLVDTPDKVKKFLVGRQFFVIFVVFLIAEITSFPGVPDTFLGMPPILITILVKTGLPGIAIVLTFGQLISQIFVEEFTLPFMNLLGCEAVIRLCLFTEYIGVCNFSWLLYHLSSSFCCKMLCAKHYEEKNRALRSNNNNNTQDDTIAISNNHNNSTALTLQTPHSNYDNDNHDGPPLSPTELNRGPDYVHLTPFDGDKPLNWFDYFKYTWSTCATLFAVILIMYAISIKAYVLAIPPAGAYLLFFCVLTILFYLEGLMIAIVATQYWDKETFKDVYRNAYKVHDIINRPDNVKRFIIGRQFCTVLTNFLLAQITTFANFPPDGYNPILFFIVVKSGLVGVLVVLSFGQLMPELLAQEYPLRFMNLIGSYSICFLSLVFDAIGVGHCAWTIYFITRNICCKSYITKGPREGPSVKMNSGDSVKQGGVTAQNTGDPSYI